jgi:hypothetical protein
MVLARTYVCAREAAAPSSACAGNRPPWLRTFRGGGPPRTRRNRWRRSSLRLRLTGRARPLPSPHTIALHPAPSPTPPSFNSSAIARSDRPDSAASGSGGPPTAGRSGVGPT